jgi:hypothetical protein
MRQRRGRSHVASHAEFSLVSFTDRFEGKDEKPNKHHCRWHIAIPDATTLQKTTKGRLPVENRQKAAMRLKPWSLGLSARLAPRYFAADCVFSTQFSNCRRTKDLSVLNWDGRRKTTRIRDVTYVRAVACAITTVLGEINFAVVNGGYGERRAIVYLSSRLAERGGYNVESSLREDWVTSRLPQA